MNQGFSDGATWLPLQPDPATGSSPTKVFASTGPYGHRRRMRDRLLERGAAALADYEILEMLFFLGRPRGDTKPLAKETINRFGSLAAVFAAPAERLLAVPGVTPNCAEAIAVVQIAAARLAAAEPREAPVLGNWDSLHAYLATAIEAPLRVLYLDSKNRLLADEREDAASQEGTVTRAVLRRALELSAVSLLLAAWRNDPCPTRADRESFLALRHAAAAVCVGVHDLVLVVGGELVSVQQEA